MNAVIISLVVAVTLTALSKVTGYKQGPPVHEHPEICASMSPLLGHIHEPKDTPAPFKLTIVSPAGQCYCHNTSVVG